MKMGRTTLFYIAVCHLTLAVIKCQFNMLHNPQTWKTAKETCQINGEQLPSNYSSLRETVAQTKIINPESHAGPNEVILWLGGSFQWDWMSLRDLDDDDDDVISDCMACHCALMGSHDGHLMLEAEQCEREITYFLCEKQGPCSTDNTTTAEDSVQFNSTCVYRHRQPQGEVTWHEAHDLCLANQGELARFQQGLKIATESLLKLLGGLAAWVGYRRTWRWTDGRQIHPDLMPWTENSLEGNMCLALNVSLDAGHADTRKVQVDIIRESCDQLHRFLCEVISESLHDQNIRDIEQKPVKRQQKAGSFSTGLKVAIIILVVIGVAVMVTIAIIAYIKRTIKWNTQKSATVAPSNGITDKNYQHSSEENTAGIRSESEDNGRSQEDCWVSSANNVEYVIMSNPVYAPSKVPEATSPDASSSSSVSTAQENVFGQEDTLNTTNVIFESHVDGTYCQVLPQQRKAAIARKPENSENVNSKELENGRNVNTESPIQLSKMEVSQDTVSKKDEPKAFDGVDSKEGSRKPVSTGQETNKITKKSSRESSIPTAHLRQLSLEQELSVALQKRQSQMGNTGYSSARSSVLRSPRSSSVGNSYIADHRQQFV